MAIVTDNIFLRGLRGRIGDVVFKVLRGKTIAARRAKKTTSFSELQQGTRTKFKEASAFAKAAMLDAERKAYYQKKALKLNLPNAYTAALTDYMREPKVTEWNLRNESALDVSKKDFEIKKVFIQNEEGMVHEVTPDRKVGNSWHINFTKQELEHPVTIIIEDETKQRYVFVHTFSSSSRT